MRHLFVSFLDKSTHSGSGGRYAGRQAHVVSQRRYGNDYQSHNDSNDTFPREHFPGALHGKAILTHTTNYHQQSVAPGDKSRIGVHGDADSEEFILQPSARSDISERAERMLGTECNAVMYQKSNVDYLPNRPAVWSLLN
jgi:hypothetical protein